MANSIRSLKGKIAVYTRGSARSCHRQVRAIKQWLTSHGQTLCPIGQYEDFGSAVVDESRAGLQQMLVDVTSPESGVQFVVVTSPDRLCRCVNTFLWLVRHLERQGIEILVCEPRFGTATE